MAYLSRSPSFFKPLFSPAPGAGQLFNLLEGLSARAGTELNAPRYNIESVDDNHYNISMEVPGFNRENLKVTTQGDVLTVEGSVKREQKPEKGEGENEPHYLYQGFAESEFSHSFNLGEHVRVENAEIRDGILNISLVRDVPEEAKPRLIKIKEH